MGNNDALIYKQNQITPNQTPEFPRLKAYPGSFVNLFWHENGHTTNNGDNDNPGYDAGLVYIYGTTKYNTATTLGQIRGWEKSPPPNSRWLTTFKFDDGKCAEEGSQGKPRGAPRWASGGGGPCQGQFQIPEDIPVGAMYTVYWVWDFSKKVGSLDPNHFEVPCSNHTLLVSLLTSIFSFYQWYSSVMDVDIVPPQGGLPDTDKPTQPQTSPPSQVMPTPTDSIEDDADGVEDDYFKDDTLEVIPLPPLIKRSAKFRAAW